jgi:transcriptional regulator with XRE-family HTH domain
MAYFLHDKRSCKNQGKAVSFIFQDGDIMSLPKSPSSINRRIKELRHTLKLSQMEFSRVISLSSGYLAGVEVEKRKVNDRLVKLISAAFKVNEKWLREGKGEMFIQGPDENSTLLVRLYKELNAEFQNYVLKEINYLLEIQDREKNNLRL